MEPLWQSHPWISFSIDLRSLPPPVWMKFGEARSKCEHLKGVPLIPTVSRELHQIFLAKGVHATTAIEGNTLSEQEVLDIVKRRDKTPKSQAYLKKEVENVIAAANKVLDSVERAGASHITVKDVKAYNKLVLNGLAVEDYTIPGEISKVQVGVHGYRGLAVQHCEEALQRLCDWLNTGFQSDKENAAVYGLIKAIVAHIYLVWIHPFGDGNGRTARLLEVRFLLEAGVPSPAGHLLSNHYNKTRSEYYRQLSTASKNGGNLCGFIEYAITGFIDQIRDQLQMVKLQQWHVTWINYIHEQFLEVSSPSKKRQRDLAISLTENGGLVSKKQMRRITIKMAEAYASTSDKTISRDLNDLIRMGLVEKIGDEYRARKEIVLQFLPRGRQGDREAQLEEASLLRETSERQQLSLAF